MSQSQFIGNLYNQIAKVLEFENNEENKLKLKLMENLVETELTNDANLAQVLKKLCEIKKIGPRDFNLLVKASDSLGHSNLSKWLRDEEISNMALYLSLTEKHDPKDANNNETDQKKNYIIVEINGVKLELKFQPYKFQVSLAKLGCDGLNNIVCVRTGSGKTLVAALVCKYWIAKLGRNNFHAVFIVPTRHLATQQMEAFVMAGFDLEDLEEIKETTKEPRTATYIRERQVVFLTAMKFYNALAQGQIRISELSMLIFDECHHTTEKHPYNDIMRFYIQEKQQQMAKMPIILGLTASLGVGRVKHAEKHLIKLCSNLRCTRISSLTRDEDIQDLKKNIPSVLDDEIIQVDIGPNGLIEFINSITEYSEKIQKVIGYSSGYFLGTSDYERTLHEMKKTYEEKNKRKELIGVRCLIDLNLIYLRAHDLPLDSCVEYAQECYDKMKYAAVSEHDDRDVKLMTSFCLKSLESLIESGKRFGDNPLYENTKLKKLVEIILKCHKGNSRGLILLRTRHGVTVMEKYLNKHPDLLNRQIQSVKLLGQNNSEDSISMNESEQKKAIEKFRKGECNILVATDIAQEGLDVPECNYVIRYEFVSNEIGTVQSRGRARANAGQLYLITQRDGLNYRRELENHERERDMQKAIVEFNKLDQNFITQEIESLYKEPPNLFQSASVQSFRDIMGDSTFPMSPSIDSLSSFTFSAPSRVPTRTGNDSNPSHFHVHCRECGVGLFPATDLRFREPSYYSINTEFIRRAIRVQDTDLPSKVFYCARASCGIELGREVAMRRGSPLYMIDIKGVKFANKNKPGNFIVHAKWSKIEFNVKPI